MDMRNPQLWFKALEFRTDKFINIDDLKNHLEESISCLECKVECKETINKYTSKVDYIENTVLVNYKPTCGRTNTLINYLQEIVDDYIANRTDAEIYDMFPTDPYDATMEVLSQDDGSIINEYLRIKEKEYVRVLRGKYSGLTIELITIVDHIVVP